MESLDTVSLTILLGAVLVLAGILSSLVALRFGALILFDGGLRTRWQAMRNVLAPAGLLATVGVLVTAAVTAPVAHLTLGTSWTESLLIGAVVGSTDAAAVFLLVH